LDFENTTPIVTSHANQIAGNPTPKNSRLYHHQLKGKILLGKYRITTTVSRGGMGAVYLARDIYTGQRHAIKLLRSDIGTMPELRKRFLLECQTTRSISHPAIVQASAVGETPEGELFIVMEYIDGPPLRKFITDKSLSIRNAILIAASCAEGLAAAHEQNIIHRDLKPENILIPRKKQDSIVKIVDFGIARIIGTPGITTTSHVLGTPNYMSPEQAMGEPVDNRTDIYSLGVILYEMLCRQLPYRGNTPEELLQSHIQSKAIPLYKQLGSRKKICPKLEELVMSCLEKKSENRPPGMSFFLDVLENLSDY
jgi:eukaryotic-like serine/threonine-protein kinase